MPPAIVCLEDPEASLHPKLMEYMADILRLGTQSTQIIATTHSPLLLNELPPESLVIVEKTDGRTQARHVDNDRALKTALQTLGLGEIWRAGHLSNQS